MNPTRQRRVFLCLVGLVAIFATVLAVPVRTVAQSLDPDITKKLGNFDAYMAKVLKDWNAPGIGVGIVKGDKLVFAKGYGYRDYGKKLPFTPATLQQIASNTKLFTAVAAGHAGRGRQADLGPARPRVRALDPLLQQRAQQHGHPARHAGPPDGHHPARHDLVPIGLHPQAALRQGQVPGAPGAPAPDLPLQQPDVRRRRLHHRAAVRQDLGGVRPRADLQAARDDLDGLRRRRHAQAGRPRRPVHREARLLRALQDPLLRGHRRGRPLRRHHLQHPGHVPLAHRPDERRQVQRPAGPAAGRAQGDARAGHRPTQHGGRSPAATGSRSTPPTAWAGRRSPTAASS